MVLKPLGQLYREHAAQEQTYADEARLGNVRALHERAAKRWVELADLADRPGASKR